MHPSDVAHAHRRLHRWPGVHVRRELAARDEGDDDCGCRLI